MTKKRKSKRHWYIVRLRGSDKIRCLYSANSELAVRKELSLRKSNYFVIIEKARRWHIAKVFSGLPIFYNYAMNNRFTVESVGSYVKKSGRTTGVTENEVIDTHATTLVFYGGLGSVVFKDQILVKQSFSWGGDSGSVVTEPTHPYRFVGLVFAASMVTSIVCKAERIWEELELKNKPKSVQPAFLSLLDQFPNIFPLLRLLLKP